MKSMRKLTIALTWILFFTTILLLFGKGYAIIIITAREDGTPTNTFILGEKVRIIISSQNCILTIEVKDPDNQVAYIEHPLDSYYNRTITGITNKPGTWTITVEESTVQPRSASTTSIRKTYTKNYVTTSLNVTPEVPLGTIVIIATFLAAFGVTIVKNKQK